MATVLLAWQFGGIPGQTTLFRPLASSLIRRGHRVFAIVRDLTFAGRVFDSSGVQLLAAPKTRPLRNDRQRKPIAPGVLEAAGFGDFDTLMGLASGWRTLFDLVRPELVVFDHSPTALLAAQGLPFRRMVMGDGFCCPTSQIPSTMVFSCRQDADNVVHACKTANSVLERWSQHPIDHVAQLYDDADETILTTYPELDPNGRREGVKYWGVWDDEIGAAPQWPHAEGKRLLAYVRPFSALPALVKSLRKSRLATLLVCEEAADVLQERYSCETIRFESRPVRMAQAAKECDMALLNVGHNIIVPVLLAGHPMMIIPLTSEQRFAAERICEIGAGLVVLPTDAANIAETLDSLSRNESHCDAAREFARTYAHLDGTQQLRRLVQRTLDLIGKAG